MDTGSETLFESARMRMEKYRGVLYCKARMEDEFTVDDVNSMIDIINVHFHGFADIILKKAGNYSVSAKCQILLSMGVKEFRNFIYVVDSKVKKDSALYAAKTYMSEYNTKVCDSREEAYSLLVDNSLKN